MAAASDTLRAQLQRRVEPDAWQVFARTLEAIRNDGTLDSLLSAFSAASRQLGRGPLAAEELVLPVEGSPDGVPLTGYTLDLAARCLLLLALGETADSKLEEAVWAAYREGDTLEKLAVVRTLPLLRGSERFVELSLDAGRTNDARLFRAVACDTPFPAQHYPELEWNKLFMKAAFVHAPLERILGLERRANSELARMALEYIEEQESAARTFPGGIWLGIAPFPPAGAVAKMLGYASHSVAEVRLGAVRGLTRVSQPRSESFLRERVAVESDTAVRAALDECLDALNSLAKA